MGKMTNNRLDTPEIYATWSKDDETRYTSTSGGAFSEFAKVILSKNGIVAGAKYNKDCMVEHCLINNYEGLNKIKQSKYISSNPRTVFRDVKMALEEGKIVGFCGSPCQVAGLYEFLGKEYDNLITFDFICRGMNSPKAFRAWLSELEKEEKSKVVRVWFKYKEGGWKSSPKRTRIDFEDNHYIIKSGKDNLFMDCYLSSNLFIRPSCGNCRFKGFPRNGDITLADFWGVSKELDDDKGTSLVLINSHKGQELFNEAKQSMTVYSQNFQDVFNKNQMVSSSVIIPPVAHDFLVDLDHLAFSEAIKKYTKTPIISKIKKKIMQYLRKDDNEKRK